MRTFYKKAALLALTLAIVFGGAIIPYAYKHRYTLLQNPLVQPLIHVYHSVRKIPDILFIPYSLSKSSLDAYELFISGENVALLNASLPPEPFAGRLLEENKTWVSADFRAGDYVEEVKVRYRGDLAVHWNSYKKSYLVKFPKRHLFEGMREMTLIVPYDRLYFSTALNNYRAKKMGLVVPEVRYINLSVNGGAQGVMIALEHWSQEFIEKQPISSLSQLFGTNNDDSLDGTDSQFSIFSQAGRRYWKSWNGTSEDFPELDTLIELVEHASDEEFRRIAPAFLNLEAFYAADTLRVLSGGYHLSDDGNNTILLFEAGEGRFKPIPFNVGLSVERNDFPIDAPLLEKRIWSIPEFKDARDNFFYNYVANNKEDDIAFVDGWLRQMKKEFYRDNAKLENNFMLTNNLRKYRGEVVMHSALTTDVLTVGERSPIIKEQRLFFPETFSPLLSVGLSEAAFVRVHPQFKLSPGGGIVLPKGPYYFNSTIIIPQKTHLTIEEGTKVFMGEHASIISYSPVTLMGDPFHPIQFLPAVPKGKWGVFAVLNTENATSTIEHSFFDGGSELHIAGILFSGTLAFHNANVEIHNSELRNAHGDDGLNVKFGTAIIEGNIFKDNVSDGIDLDAVAPGSLIKNNSFTDNGGDALDISWSPVTIVRNTIERCKDKGISVGERSEPIIVENTIVGCDIGIAVKDQSRAVIEGNVLKGNNTAVSAYQKKEWFGGGYAIMKKNVLEGNGANISTDGVSSVEGQE